jgi:hypothetical protein
VDFLRNLKAKKEMSNFGSKEVPTQTGASGSKSKELGFTISRGIVRCDPRSPRPEFSESKAVKRTLRNLTGLRKYAARNQLSCDRTLIGCPLEFTVSRTRIV